MSFNGYNLIHNPPIYILQFTILSQFVLPCVLLPQSSSIKIYQSSFFLQKIYIPEIQFPQKYYIINIYIFFSFTLCNILQNRLTIRSTLCNHSPVIYCIYLKYVGFIVPLPEDIVLSRWLPNQTILLGVDRYVFVGTKRIIQNS